MSILQIISIIVASLMFLAIGITGLKTDLLKESNQPGKPYSFHKFQLWIWTLIICPSFALYWGAIKDNKPYINETALILLGISAATAVTAEIIGAAQKNNLTQNVSLKAMNLQTTGFWADILKDDTGQLSIGRLQQLMFTFIYVVIYISEFFPLKDDMMYPSFDPTAYTLMGISASTYLVAKGMNK